VYGVCSVLAPRMPTITPATSTIVVGGMFGHLMREPLFSSRMLVTRNGNFASCARALSAPRGSSSIDCAVTAGPSGP
jgi:LSD1 subclass zinc finger protein